MLAWLVLLILLIAEVGGLAWWLRTQFYPVFFNGWATLIYSGVLEADFILTWLVSMLEKPGGTFGTALLAALGVALVIIVFLGTVFFRWVVSHDMTDIPK